MTYAEMMAEMLVPCRESARALEMLAQAIVGNGDEGPDLPSGSR